MAATDEAPPTPGPDLTDVAPIEALQAPVDRLRGVRALPLITRRAISVVHAAAPGELRAGVILQVLIAVSTGVQLFVLKSLVSGLLKLARDQGTPVTHVIPSFLALMVTTVVAGVLSVLLDQQQKMLGEKVARQTTDRIIDVATRVDLARFEDPVFYDELERATVAGTFRPVEMVNALMALLLAVFTSIGVIVALLALEPLLVPLVVLAGVPVLLTTIGNSRRSYAFEYEMTGRARERFFLFELFTMMEAAKELRVFAAVPYLRRRYDTLSDERISRMRAYLRTRLLVSMLGIVASAIGTVIALGSLVLLLSSGHISVATAGASAIAMQLLAGRLSTVTSSLGKLIEAGMFMGDLQRFLRIDEHRPTPSLPAAPVEPLALERLSVRDLTFTYPGTDRQVLHDVSLEVRKGEVVALVGENGSGKTTLVKVLCQLYEAPPGTLEVNGRAIAELDPAAVRAGTTVLFQDFVQYHLSVNDNVALGRSDVPVDAEAIRAAVARAGAEPLVGALEKGLETRLGRQFLGGAELSGGQWQRVALARAFYRGGELLIMDEPTAALDPRAEFALFEQMRELAVGKGLLLISHRFSNVRMADRIYVLEAGRVVEQGRHEELMAREGLYAELFRLQAAAYLGEEAGEG